MRIKIILTICLSVFFIVSQEVLAQCNNFKMWIPEWKDVKYKNADTAQDANYLSEEEKAFYYYLNLLRLNPILFSETFLKKCTEWNNTNKLGYVVMFSKDMRKIAAELKGLAPLPVVYPQKEECILTTCYNKDKSCVNFKSGGSSSSMYYENTGLRLLMSILKSQSNSETKRVILSKNTGYFGISILPNLKRGKASARITMFSRKVLEIEPNQSGDKIIEDYTAFISKEEVKYEKEFRKAVPSWNEARYSLANTAKNTSYLTENEKLVYYYLNLARMNPSLFAETFLVNYTDWNSHEDLSLSSYYTGSLYKTLKKMKPVGLLYPNDKLFESAKCHAVSSGKTGYVGHTRLRNSGCKANFAGECCSYGHLDALEIVMQLLIDSGVPNLGHRKICLDGSYETLGASVQPHTQYRFNAVLDFGR